MGNGRSGLNRGASPDCGRPEALWVEMDALTLLSVTGGGSEFCRLFRNKNVHGTRAGQDRI